MRFKEFINQGGAFSYSDESPFGSGRSITLPTRMMDDLTHSVQGIVTNITQKSNINQDNDMKIKVKTPSGIFTLNNKNNKFPQIGDKINVIINRFGEAEDWN